MRRKLYTTFGRQCALDSEFQQTFLSQIIKNFSFSGPGPHFPGSPSPSSAPCLLYAPTSWLLGSLCQYRSCYKIQQLRAPRHTVSHKMLPTSLNLLTSSSTKYELSTYHFLLLQSDHVCIFPLTSSPLDFFTLLSKPL